LKLIKAILLALVLGAIGLISFEATAQVAVPPLTARVTDQTGTLTTDQLAALDQTLQTFESRKGTQIAVLIVSTTEPETIEQFAASRGTVEARAQTGRRWRVAHRRKKRQNAAH
jgi:uncharacterized protein